MLCPSSRCNRARVSLVLRKFNKFWQKIHFPFPHHFIHKIDDNKLRLFIVVIFELYIHVCWCYGCAVVKRDEQMNRRGTNENTQTKQSRIRSYVCIVCVCCATVNDVEMMMMSDETNYKSNGISISCRWYGLEHTHTHTIVRHTSYLSSFWLCFASQHQ